MLNNQVDRIERGGARHVLANAADTVRFDGVPRFRRAPRWSCDALPGLPSSKEERSTPDICSLLYVVRIPAVRAACTAAVLLPTSNLRIVLRR